MIYECEWNSGQFSGENGDWLSELSAGGNIGDGRERGRRLGYGDWVLGELGKGGWGDCVLMADFVDGIG